MHFELTETQKKIRETVRQFAETELRPVSERCEKSGEFPYSIIKRMGELGLMGMVVPKGYGGPGVDTLSYAIAVEEISRVCGSTGLTMAAHNSLCTYNIVLAGTETQKSRYLPELASARKLGAWGLTEPNAGSDASALQTTAYRDGNDWVINGTKIFITNGHVAEIFVVIARTDERKGHRGISAFIVEKGTKGFTLGKKEDKLGLRASVTSELVFEDCRVPNDAMLGKEGEGFINALKVLDGGRISIGAMAVGIGQGALDACIEYAKKRIQFDQPIYKFQMVQHMIVNMAMEIDAARLLVYKCAYMKDRGLKFTKESAMAKLFASEVAMRAAVNAIQIYGARGCTGAYPVERFFRDVKLCEIGEGTSEIQRLVIARQLGLK